MKSSDEPLRFANRADWRAWLQEHHAEQQAAWLVLYKKKAAGGFLTLQEAVEEALCFGWIDGVLSRVGAETYALRFSPRKPGSIWSAINKDRALQLIRQGQMTAAGLERIAEAQANGEWEAATARENVEAIPADLAAALKKQEAWVAFQQWPASRKKQYLYWLARAKRATRRQKRPQVIVEMASGTEKLGRK